MRQDNNEIYNLEEEEDDRRIPKNENPEGEELKEESGQKEKKRPSPLRLLLQMMVNPTEGWKRIRRSGLTSEEVARGCFYPLSALASVSVFMRAIYGTQTDVTALVITALVVFMSFFFSFFVTSLFTRILLPKDVQSLDATEYGKQYALYLLSTLTIFYTLGSLLPMLEAVLVFLPLWTIYLASKGTRWMHLPDNRKHTVTALLSAIVVLSPVGIYLLFDSLLQP